MRLFLLIAVTGTMALAESHPSWWGLAEPDATALVGIRWENLRQSPFADPVATELSSLGFPDLALLGEARQILISSPSLAMMNGVFPPATLRSQAAAKGMKPAGYRGYELWIAPATSSLSVAQLSEQLVLIGSRKALDAAIDRSLTETGRVYSPLLARAARFAQTMDLWVVAAQLPDPLASRFVPFEADARSFEAGVSTRDGLQLEASLEAESDRAAADAAANLRRTIPALPEIARNLQIAVDGHTVTVGLDLSQIQLAASLRPKVVEPPKPAPVAVPEPPPEPKGPQIIRIFGLDDGVREIVLPPKQ